MARQKFKCDRCLKEFLVYYTFIKPQEATCPHCGNPAARQTQESGCGCGDKKNGFRFT